MTSVLLLGATGHLGAHFLTALLTSQPDIHVSAYIRLPSSPAAQDVVSLGATVVDGTFEELQKLTDLCAKYPIVINAADSVNVTLTRAILFGLHQQQQSSGKKGTLIHVSGSGNFTDGGKDGNRNVNSKIWNDSNEDDIRAINSTMKNGGPDEVILKAAAAGDVNAYIVCPVGIHGIGKTDIRINSRGVLMTGMIKNVTSLGYSPYIGDGTAVLQTVHIDDVVSFMLLVFAKAIDSPPNTSPYSNYYVVAGPESTWKDMSSTFAEVLHAKGKIASPEARQVPFEEAGFLARLYGANLFVKDDNARSLGYKPQGPTIFESFKSIQLD